jgi:hypothetical protein
MSEVPYVVADSLSRHLPLDQFLPVGLGVEKVHAEDRGVRKRLRRGGMIRAEAHSEVALRSQDEGRQTRPVDGMVTMQHHVREKS